MMISRTKAGLVTLVMRQTMNREYLSAKAELCSNLAVEQIANGNEEEGVKNLKRMIRALNEIHLLDIQEGGKK
jgi:diphthamide synthase (EF-2-diphthine--ammonia ligase)